MSQAIGMVGLGLMGTAMSRNLLAAGFQVIGYDLLPEKVAFLLVVVGPRAGTQGARIPGMAAQ